MPRVWIKVDALRRTRFHRTPDCRQLRKGPARGPGNPVVELDLEQVHVRPCRTCYPDAPRIDVLKRPCEECQTNHPCPHNGGVSITDRAGRRFWVWPNTNQMPLYRKTAS